MKKSALIALIAVIAGATASRADVWGVNYSGRFIKVENNQKVVPANILDNNAKTIITVRIYDETDGSGTNVIWQEDLEARVLDGWFTLELDGLEDALAGVSGANLTIGVTPDGGTEITPRQKFASVPTAVCALDALGTKNSLMVTGQLTAETLQASTAEFYSTVTHEGQTVFKTKFSLPELQITNSAASFSVGEMSVDSQASIANVSATSVVSDGKATLELTSVGMLSAKTLAATSSVVIIEGGLQGAGGTNTPGDLTVDGDMTANNVSVDRLRVGPSYSFFQWEKNTFRLLPNKTEDSVYGYAGDGSSGKWKAQWDCFLSISPISKKGTAIRITITPINGEAVEYTQSASGGAIAMPLQMFVNKGDRVEWSGADSEDTRDYFRPYLTYRKFTY